MKRLVIIVTLCGLLLAVGAFLAIALSLPDVKSLKTQNPKTTALIDQRLREARRDGAPFKRRQVWVSFESIPELLKDAVRVAEDARFYEHEGIDYEELQEAVRQNLEHGQIVRGASTITQQLAKNLFLSTERSYTRKVKEYLIARHLEQELSKNRIFHLYLNVIEFGPGVFGVEAAARHYFDKSAAQLNLEEIVRLTAVIPKPLSESPVRNSRWLNWRARWILSILKKTGHVRADQYQQTLVRFK